MVSVPGTLRVGFVDSLVPLLVHGLDWVVAAGACTVVPVFHLVLVCLAVFFMVAKETLFETQSSMLLSDSFIFG